MSALAAAVPPAAAHGYDGPASAAIILFALIFMVTTNGISMTLCVAGFDIGYNAMHWNVSVKREGNKS